MITASCSSTQQMSHLMEDDIYYTPGKETQMAKEVVNSDNLPVSTREPREPARESAYAGSTTAPVINRRTGTVEQINVQNLVNEAQEKLATEEDVNAVIYQNTGYWIGGFKGNDYDLREAARIINMYPDGFAYFSNGYEIAMNLSFSPDWNVYTDNNRYWWFPTSSNIDLYTTFIFGSYPKYIWTVIWNSPYYDSWAFNTGFNVRINYGWGNSGFGWKRVFYDPYYPGWYGPYYWDCYDPYHYAHYHGYPYYGYNNWYNHDYYYPYWSNYHSGWKPSLQPRRPNYVQRPNHGAGITGTRPGNTTRPTTGPATRPTNSYRPTTGNRANEAGMPNNIRPGSNQPGIITRPGSNNTPGTVIRPSRRDTEITRPESNPTTRMNQPNSNTIRPNAPANTTRPDAINRSNSNINTTRPGATVRPNTSTRPTTVRPATNNRNDIKNYTRPQNESRPTYNNNRSNSSRDYTPSSSHDNSSYTPSRSSGSSGSSESYTPSRSSGGGGSGGSGADRPSRR